MRRNLQRMGLSALSLLGVWVLFSPMRAAAEDNPDLREIIPFMMLAIDTSASMERLPACGCTTAGCEECLPNCDALNVGGIPPKDVQGREVKKNRWSVVLEALTGTFNDFQCERLARTATNGMTYDIGFSMPHFQPWDCNNQLPFTACAYGSTNATANDTNQQRNGIIDTYSSNVRFGLMTFDGFDTYVGGLPLVPVPEFQANVNFSNGVQGLWSYGGGHAFKYVGCPNEYMIDTGVRNATAAEGNLVSLNSCLGPGPIGSPTCPSWCSACPADQASISHDIQQALLKSRPYGGTPIAAALDDLYYHLKTDLTDQFGSCRHRFALLMTDGLPDLDYRDFDCDCAKKGGTDPCGPGVDPTTIKCPYPLPEDVAADLIHGRDPDKAMLERLFVVGLAIGDDTRILDRLNTIAEAGCPDVGGCRDADNNTAFFADDLSKLVQQITKVIDDLIRPVSRSVPAFAIGTSIATSNTQYQISTGFKVASETGEPWTGVMERRRFVCGATDGVLAEATVGSASGDNFQDVLNAPGAARRLLTALPLSGSPDGYMYRDTSSSSCGSSNAGSTGCQQPVLFSPNSATNIPAPALGLATNDTAGRLAVMNWMVGASGSVRANKRLGDIYHSSPVLVGAPQFDTSDEAFNLFRQRPEIASRPLTAFVGSNDGILHAFSIDDWTPPTGLFNDVPYAAGQEMWGFIPPLFLNNLKDNLDRHQFMVDGTPLVKNVYFNKADGVDATGQEYHTVLVTGMREGGNAYIALDVTDPTAPKFLWQFTDAAMGLTFAQPGIGQAKFIGSVGGTSTPKNGAVAILPGGVGQIGVSGVSGDCPGGAATPSMRAAGGGAFTTEMPQAGGTLPTHSHRSDVRCWKDIGRALYFVDVETGKLLKKIHRYSDGKLVFPSPLVSTPALFGASVGSVTSRAFITDADGVIWRVDLSAPDQKNTLVYTPDASADPNDGWQARPFHDIFWDRSPSQGELTYEAPMLSVDNDGRLIVIVGTGDNNNFVKPTIENRVVSLTELSTATATTSASLNWELRVKPNGGLVPSELVTGSMGLFNGQLFFGTFIAVSGGDACDVGKGRIHAVDYIQNDPTDTNGSSTETYGPHRIPASELSADSSGTSVINVDASDAVDNFMVMGLGVTQRLTCQTVDTADFNVSGSGNVMGGVTNVAQPAIYLVAQASGKKTTGGLVQERANSQLGSIELRLKKTAASSRVTSWATSVD